MEAVPRLPMLSFDLKVSEEYEGFGPKFKQYIRDHYNEDPEMYANEINQLEGLRSSAVRPARDVTGCATLKKYFCQLNFLLCRFPMYPEGEAAIRFTWKDLYTNMVCSVSSVSLEIVSILYNIGALHSQLGAADNRTTTDGMKMSCTHFQCAAWAFQHLRDEYPQAMGLDLSHDMMFFMNQMCLAQAQECILEKSMMDNRKATIIAKVAVQTADYYKHTLKLLAESPTDENSFAETIGSKLNKKWEKYLKFKVAYHKSIALLYQGQQAEEQQKMGERVAYYQAAFDKLEEAKKLAKGLENKEVVNEALTFTHDVVEGKRKAAKNENEFIYHEEVPDITLLADVKGASLVKGISFNINDLEVSGPDIFGRIVPMKAHESSSLYSEEKAKLMRRVGGAIDSGNEELESFLSTLQLDHLNEGSEGNRLPQDLIDRCAALSAKPDAIQNLIEAMNTLADTFHDVESMLNDIRELLAEEDNNEKDYQQLVGKRPPSIAATDLTREANKYQEAHNKASESNQTLHKAMVLHIANLRLLSLPLRDLELHIPSVVMASPEDEASLKEMQHLMSKVDEMRRQRAMLFGQLRDSVAQDDITRLVVTYQGESLTSFFQDELKKHQHCISLIETNLSAQDNILRAVKEAYVRYATTRRNTGEMYRKREGMIAALIASYDAYEDLILKSTKGMDFYRKLETNVAKLLQRVKGTCKVQDEERQQILANNMKAAKAINSEMYAEAATGGMKLRDYLNIKKETGKLSLEYSPATAANPYYNAGAPSPSPQLYEMPGAQSWVPGVRPAPVGSEETETTAKIKTDVHKPEQTWGNAFYTADGRGKEAKQGYYPYGQDGGYSTTTSSNDAYQPYQAKGYSGYAADYQATQGYTAQGYSHQPASQPPGSYPQYQYPNQQPTETQVGTMPYSAPVSTPHPSYTNPLPYSTPSTQPSYPSASSPQPSYSFGVNTQQQSYPAAAPTPQQTYSAVAPTPQQTYSAAPTPQQAYPAAATPQQTYPAQLPNYSAATNIQQPYQPPAAALTSQTHSYVATPTTLQHSNSATAPTGQQVYSAAVAPTPYSTSGAQQTYSAAAIPNPQLPYTAVAPSAQQGYTAATAYSASGAPTSQQAYSTMNPQQSYSAPAPQSIYSAAPQTNYSSPYHVSTANPNESGTSYLNVQSPSGYPTPMNNVQQNPTATNYSNQQTEVSANYVNQSNTYPAQSSATNYASQPSASPINYSQSNPYQTPTNYPNQPLDGSNYYQSAEYIPSQYNQSYPPSNAIAPWNQTYTQANDVSQAPSETTLPSQSYFQTGNQSLYTATQNYDYAMTRSGETSQGVPATAHYYSEQYGASQPHQTTYMQAGQTESTTTTYTNEVITSPTTDSSNVDLLAGLDFNIDQNPLQPVSARSEAPVRGAAPPPQTQVQPQAEPPAQKSPAKEVLSDSETQAQFVLEVEKLEKVVEGLSMKTLNGPTGLDLKWKELVELQEVNSRNRSISVARCYPMKNRFPDILPFDDCRVELPSTKDDYINASRLKGLSPNTPDMILTQSPLPSTRADFWTMVLEQQVEVIVCLLSDAELGEESYWPGGRGDVLEAGRVKVALQSVITKSHWVERILGLSVVDSRQSRVVVHLQFTAWPGSSFPASPSPFLHFTSEFITFLHQQRSLSHPPVVHCLSGVGRTGLFCVVVAALLEAASRRVVPDVLGVAARVAEARSGALRDREHLKFAYQAVLYHCQDLLMKQGILTSRSSFDDRKHKEGKCHTRHPSEDFLLGPAAADIQTLQSGVEKLGFDSVGKAPEAVEPRTGPPSRSQSSCSASSSGRTSPSAGASLEDPLTALDPGSLSQHAARRLAKKRFTPESFSKASLPSLDAFNTGSEDPLSRLDPLWTLKK